MQNSNRIQPGRNIRKMYTCLTLNIYLVYLLPLISINWPRNRKNRTKIFGPIVKYLYSNLGVWIYIHFSAMIALLWILISMTTYSIEQWFLTFLSHDTCKLIAKILQHTQKYNFCPSDKENSYDVDSFIPHDYCVGYCLFLFCFVFTIQGTKVSASH